MITGSASASGLSVGGQTLGAQQLCMLSSVEATVSDHANVELLCHACCMVCLGCNEMTAKMCHLASWKEQLSPEAAQIAALEL